MLLNSFTKLYTRITIVCVAILISTITLTSGLILFARAVTIDQSMQNVGNGTISFYNNYYFYQVANGLPLFTSTGINENVAAELRNIISDVTARRTPVTYQSSYYERTAKGFSDWALNHFNVPQSRWDNPCSGGVFVRLFDSFDEYGRQQPGVVGQISNMWYQVVYTSATTANGEPIITFFAIDSYKIISGFFPNDVVQWLPKYRTSAIRVDNLLPDYSILSKAYPLIDSSADTPSMLPGEWQSQVFQTGGGGAVTGSSTSLVIDTGLTDNQKFAYQNGMNADGYKIDNITPNEVYMEDKMWIPSAFETFCMGNDKEDEITFGPTYVGGAEGVGITKPASGLTDGLGANNSRSGLWRLNGYDRSMPISSGNAALRSLNRYNILDPPIEIGYRGSRYIDWMKRIPYPTGVRPAFHITLPAVDTNVRISFNSNGGSNIGAVEVPSTATSLATYRPADPTRDGYTFGGWYRESGLTNVFNFATESAPSNDITLYARWISNPTYIYSISLSSPPVFADVQVGYAQPAAQSVTITNTGNQATGPLTINISESTFQSSLTQSGSYNSTNKSVNSIPISGTATFWIRPSPSLGVGNYSVTVTASGENPFSAQFTTFFRVTPQQPSPIYSISINYPSMFTDAYVGYAQQAAQSVTITNTGNQSTGPLTVNVSSDAFQSSLTQNGTFDSNNKQVSAIAVSALSTFWIRPAPSLGIGDYTVMFSVSGGNGIFAQFSVTFRVLTQPIHSISLSSPPSFTNVRVGYPQPAAQSVTITNTGNQATGQMTINTSGTAFQVSQTQGGTFGVSCLTNSLAAGETSTFWIRPNIGLAVGVHSAIITINGSNNINEQLSVGINVSGQYGIALSHSSFVFEERTVGYQNRPAALSVSVLNIGDFATGYLTVAITGTGSGSFDISRTSIDSIGAGAMQTFTVQPKAGLDNGNWTASITVSGVAGIHALLNVSFFVNVAPSWEISVSQTEAHNFMSSTVGYFAPPTALTVTVNNIGNQPTGALNLVLSGANANSFELSTTQLTSIDRYQTKFFTVRPILGLAVGEYIAVITVSGIQVDSRSFNVRFIVGSANVSLSETGIHEFIGRDENGNANPLTVVVSNTGSQSTGQLTIVLSGENAGSFLLSATMIPSIGSNRAANFTVRPKNNLAAGVHTAIVTVSGANFESQSFTIQITIDESEDGPAQKFDIAILFLFLGIAAVAVGVIWLVRRSNAS